MVPVDMLEISAFEFQACNEYDSREL